MNEIRRIEVPAFPPLNSTYSQAVRVGDLIFLSGQIGVNPKTGDLLSDEVGQQTEQILKNTELILKEANSSLDQIFWVCIFITDMRKLGELNEIFSKYIKQQPAKTAVEISSLYDGAKVEMQFIALSRKG